MSYMFPPIVWVHFASHVSLKTHCQSFILVCGRRWVHLLKFKTKDLLHLSVRLEQLLRFSRASITRTAKSMSQLFYNKATTTWALKHVLFVIDYKVSHNPR